MGPPNLAAACAWLDAWRAEGRGVTISVLGEITAWWLPDPALTAAARNLLDQLDQDAGLKFAVRAVVHAEAIIRSTGQQITEAA